MCHQISEPFSVELIEAKQTARSEIVRSDAEKVTAAKAAQPRNTAQASARSVAAAGMNVADGLDATTPHSSRCIRQP